MELEWNVVGPLIALAVFLWMLACLNKRLAAEYPGDVRGLWFLFFLTATLTTLGALWALKSGVFDDIIANKAAPENASSTAIWLWQAFTFVTDIKGELIFLGLCIGLVVIPQFLSYLVCALLGCAATPSFVSATLTFVFWNLMKFLVVAASVQLTTGAFRFASDWNGKEQAEGAAYGALGLAAAFQYVLIYRSDMHLMLVFPFDHMVRMVCEEPTVQSLVQRFKKWARRNTAPPPEPSGEVDLKIVAGVVFPYRGDSAAEGVGEILTKLSLDKLITDVEPFIIRVDTEKRRNAAPSPDPPPGHEDTNSN